MSSPELSPKYSDAVSALPSDPFTMFSKSEGPLFSHQEEDQSPPAAAPFESFLQEIHTTPLVLEKQPTAADLIIQDEDVILDPATPRTPKHRQAENQLLHGKAMKVLKHHMAAVVKVFTCHTKPNFELPWQTRQQTKSTSTGIK